MRTCPKCSGIMGIKKTAAGALLVCLRCGHTEKGKTPESSREAEDIPVVESREETLPTTKTECPKCGNTKAFWWMRQTRAADEPTTRFYKCTECGNVWREYA